ncbi:MAG: NAD-dependent epimerase/dehydratase family protein [Bacteroidetes bacterium]|nr:NAD-dependent epimerase/dehydratase family protein [Bacteroidota bacterium]
MQNVAIIGSNGFIGRHLTQRLSREKNNSLYLFGRGESSISAENLPYKKIDFFDKEKLKTDFSNIDIVYYLASETIPATSWDTPMLEIEKNLIPFINFLEVISKLQVKKVAFVSSAGTVYGTTEGRVPENSDKKPFSPYGITKLTMENFLSYYKVRYGIQYDVYRVSNVYGEGQDIGKGLGIINTFLEKIIKEKQVKVYGDGEATRNYIYVKDVAELLSFSVRNISSSDIFNISSNSTLSINNLVKVMKIIVREDFTVSYEQGRKSDNSYIDLDNSKILGSFDGFEFTNINDGVRKTYNSLVEMVKSEDSNG